MPRPQNPGLDYWSLDVHWIRESTIMAAQSLVDPDGQDMRLRYLVASFFRDLVNEVFRDNGYYLVWDKNTVLGLSSAYCLPTTYIEKFIAIYIKVGLFDSDMFENKSILTSCGIQMFWIEIQKSVKKVHIIQDDYNLDVDENVDNVSLPTELKPFRRKKLPLRRKLVHKYIFSTFYFISNTISNNTLIENNKEKSNNKKESSPTEETTSPTEETTSPTEETTSPTEETTSPTEETTSPTEETTSEETYGYKVQQYRLTKGVLMPLEFCKRMFFEHKDFERHKMNVFGSFPKDIFTNEEIEHYMRVYADRFNDFLFGTGVNERSAGQWSSHFGNWVGNQPKVKKDAKQLEIIFPFNSEEFKGMWASWKAYYFAQHNTEYKSVEMEQAALMSAAEKADGVEKIAISIIKQSMASGWKTFHKLKDENQNGTTGSRSGTKKPTGKDVSMSAIFATIDSSIPKDGGVGTGGTS